MLVIGAIILAIVAAAVVIVGLPLVQPRTASNPSASGMATEPTSALPSADAAAEPPGLADSLWWRFGWEPLEGAAQPRAWHDLTIGLLDGTDIGTITLAGSASGPGTGPPFAKGPSLGVIVYATDIGAATELRAVRAHADEADVLLASVRGMIYDAALAPMAGVAYFATGPPDGGVWRVPLDASARPERVLAPPEVVGLRVDAMLVPGVDQLPKQVTLAVDPAEGRLAIYTCTATCTLRIVTLPDLQPAVSFPDLPPTPRALTAFGDDALIIDTQAFDPMTGVPLDGIPVDMRWHGAGWVGYELPAGWRMETREIEPNAMVVGPTRYVAIDPMGAEFFLDFLGPGPGQG